MSTDAEKHGAPERQAFTEEFSHAPAPISAAELAAAPGVLGQIARERAADYADAAAAHDASALAALRAAVAARPGFAESLRTARDQAVAAGLTNQLAVIAEVKRSSPSQGAIAAIEPVDAARAYQAGGAAALSVLTEPRHFGGNLEHLNLVSGAVSLPLLRKEFTVHPQQVVEAAAHGASAVLLIVALLQQHTAAYLRFARSLGLDALVEVHDDAELEIALAAGATLLGVNNRDLSTLQIDLGTAPRLVSKARESGFTGLAVAESGYRSAAELNLLNGIADAVLVGTSLVGSGDLATAVRRLRGAP